MVAGARLTASGRSHSQILLRTPRRATPNACSSHRRVVTFQTTVSGRLRQLMSEHGEAMSGHVSHHIRPALGLAHRRRPWSEIARWD